MKKTHIWLGLCLLLALVILKQETTAQLAPANDAMAGVGLGDAAENARAALTAGDYRAVHGLLDAAATGQVALAHEKFLYHVDTSRMTDEQAKAFIDNCDPRGELKVKTVNELMGITPVQFFALTSGLLRGEKKPGPAMRWFLIYKSVGLTQPRSRELRRMDVLPWGGAVVYKNRADASITLYFSLDGGAWRLSDYSLDSDDLNLEFSSAVLNEGAWDDDATRWNSREQAEMAEGEQLLDSARDATRVQYSKTGVAPISISSFQRLDSFEGEYYSIEDTVHLIGANSAAILAKPTGKRGAWGFIRFEWDSGNSKIEWFKTEAKRDARIKELKTSPEVTPEGK